jgi:transcriptional regulator with XRE-family HTH domain
MPHPVDAHVGAKIRQARVLRGMSQTALADRLGVTFQQVQKYEKGTNRVGASRLWNVASALALPIEFFFEGLDAPTSESAETDARRTLSIARDIQMIGNEDAQHQLKALVRLLARNRENQRSASELPRT